MEIRDRIIRDLRALGVREGDMITVAVTVSGVYEEQDDAGNSVAVPRFELVFVDKVE